MKPSLRQAVGAVIDRRKLKVLDILCAEGLARAHDAVQRRLSMHRLIAECAQPQVPQWARRQQVTSYVALVRSGMDCDGVQYGNDVTYVPASWREVETRIDDDCRHADGPIYHQIMKPSEAAGLRKHSRDLALEAFEDGHPHRITYCPT
jgi:hypothetical protein